jgi:CHAD domain-containing protein
MTVSGEMVEIEWQFDALDLRPVERWLATLPTLSIDADPSLTITALARTPRRLVDVYLDTDDWRMAAAGFVLRTRRRGRQDEATLKDTKPAEDNGLRQRLEVTEILPGAGMGALSVDGPVGRRVHAIAGRRPLREILQVRTRRRPFALRVGGVDAAEIALDETMIVVGQGQRPMQLRRVEVEVLPEWVEALEPIVFQLRAACGLQPATLSKFEAGLLAVGANVPTPPDLGNTEVAPDTSMGDLAYAVLRRQLAVMRAKEPGTRLGEDVEELHDMRVATRRLRAALDLFVGVLPVRAQSYRDELSWLAGVLGQVRDLDVQQEGQAELADAVAGWGAQLGLAPGEDPLADLNDLLERERANARDTMLAALDSPRWDRLQRGLATMAQQGPLRRSSATRLPAAMAVPELVEARHAAVVKAAKRAKKSGVATDFHRLRIRCKRLRYSLEFSTELYEGRTSRYTKQLTKLQDQLGTFQDSEVASTRLAALATGEANLAPATIFIMGGVAQHHHREMDRLLALLPGEVARVGGKTWRDLLRVMEDRRLEAEAAQPPVRRILRAVPAPAAEAEATLPAPAVPTTTTLPSSVDLGVNPPAMVDEAPTDDEAAPSPPLAPPGPA